MDKTDESPNPSGRANGRDLTIVGGGAATTAATVGLLMWIYTSFGVDLSSFSVWFVVPVGALLAGVAAASGYYFVAKWTHTMPKRRMMVHSVIIAGGAWMSILWLKYTGMTFEDGVYVRDSVDFWTWFKITTENMSLNVRARSGASSVETGALGAFGYVRQVIQLAGFAFGGLFVYYLLTDAPTCANCRRYAKIRSLTRLGPAAFDDMISATGLSFPGLVDRVSAVAQGKGISQIELELQTCPECGNLKVAPKVWIGREGSPTRLPAYGADQDLVDSIDSVAK